MKGNSINGIESGEWTYFNRKGELVQKGSFINGKRVGKWTYLFKDVLDTDITWNIWDDSIPGFSISLPSSFVKNENTRNDIFFALDKSNGDVFSIKSINNMDMKEYYEGTLNELNKSFSIINQAAYELQGPQNKTYLASFIFLRSPEGEKGCSMCGAYFICDSTLIDFSFSTSLEDSTKGKRIFGDIIQAAYYKNARLASPFDKIVN